MFTNIGFDVLLEWLFKLFGPDFAQRIGASIVVLVFTTGAFLFVSRISHRRPLFLLPLIAMLAYGLMFQLGLFNFEASMGFSLAAVAVRPSGWRRIGLIAVLIVIAFTCHPYPVVWAGAFAGYRELATRMRARWTPLLFIASIAALILLRLILINRPNYTWWPMRYHSLSLAIMIWQTRLTGAEHVWTGGSPS